MRFYEIIQIVPVFSFVVALVLTILMYVLVLPESRRSSLNGFFRSLADIFNFKSLLLEKILKFLYVFSTLSILAFGILLFLFTLPSGYPSQCLTGLLTAVLGPVALRIVYELLMMGILLVKNVIEINKKLGVPAKSEAPIDAAEPAIEKEAEEISLVGSPVFEPAQEPAQEAKRVCSACGRKLSKNAVAFCEFCGSKLEN